jgi:YhcH/YjgK/YiaL family protein
MIYSKIEHINRFIKKDLKEIFAFAEKLNPDIAVGRHDLRGKDIYVSVMEYKTKKFADCALEAHKEYIDIQILLSGRELAMTSDVEKLEIEKKYDTENDVVFFKKPVSFVAYFKLHPGIFAVFFPEDAHMTQIIPSGCPESVKKAVIKVRSSLF